MPPSARTRLEADRAARRAAERRANARSSSPLRSSSSWPSPPPSASSSARHKSAAWPRPTGPPWPGTTYGSPPRKWAPASATAATPRRADPGRLRGLPVPGLPRSGNDARPDHPAPRGQRARSRVEFRIASFLDGKLGGNGSKYAANAAGCAQDAEAFKAYHGVLYAHQPDERSDGFGNRGSGALASQVDGLRGGSVRPLRTRPRLRPTGSRPPRPNSRTRADRRTPGRRAPPPSRWPGGRNSRS
ncbi:DsbA family protein [Yinghuangia aomiensis]